MSEQLPGGGFRYHQGQVWMSGFGPDDLDQVYRYDLDTEEMTDPRPAASFPLLSFELAPIGLDLFRDGGGEPAGYNRAPDPEPGDTWRLTDLASGEVIGDFDFGHWSPLFATDDHLWLTKGEAGQELARFEFGG